MLTIVALLVILFIETSESLNVVVPRDHIVAPVGSTVTLPCWISPPENAEALEIRWYRHEFSNPVLLHQPGKILVQEESYRNRSSLAPRSDQSGGLEDGDVSLRLEKLRIKDEGLFHCYVSGESAYDSSKVVLNVTALGSVPVLFPQPLDDGRMNISCKSSGWYPEPGVTWRSDERTVLRPGGVSRSRGADEMFSVHSWTAVSHSDAHLVSCSISVMTGESREGRLNIQAIISSDSSGPWKALFFILLFCALLALAGQILYKYRHKLIAVNDRNTEELKNVTAVNDTITEEQKQDTEKHKADVGAAPDASPSPNCEEKTATGSIPQDSGQTRPSADEGVSSSLRGTASATHLQTADVHSRPPEIVGDTDIEELRRHAVQITIDPERSYPDLMVTKDFKIVREAPGYNPTGRGFPYELCALGAQRFTSGRHYWEVDLAREYSPPKDYWLIGVTKHGSVRVKDKSALTPSSGFWFLCSDGPKGVYTSTDHKSNPLITLSLTPRPEQLGVLLDYDHGQLSFYSVKERKLLLTMSTRFSGSVAPLFNPGVGDHSPLEILDCLKPVESAVETAEEFSEPLLSKSGD